MPGRLTLYVFISYSHDDADFAAGLAARLNRAGVPYFRDTEIIQWGEDIPDRVHSALDEATHLVVLISPGSAHSAWVAYEMGYARGRRITLVPYLLHPRMDVPGFIANIRHLRTRSEEAKFIASLQNAVKRAALSRRRAQTKRTTAGTLKPEREITDALNHIKGQHPQVRRDAVEVLVQHRAASEMMRLLGHRDPNVRSAAAAGLARLKHKEALKYLVDGLGYTSKRSRASVIPDVEDVFVHYGREGLDYLLKSMPERLGYYDAPVRWTRALANVVDRDTVSLLLARAHETGRREFLEAALKSGHRLKRAELEAAIDSYLRKEELGANWGHAQVAEWLSESPHSRSTWVRRLVKGWLESDIQEYGPRAKDGECWTTERLVETALSIEALAPAELEQLANISQNRSLGEALLKYRREWDTRQARAV